MCTLFLSMHQESERHTNEVILPHEENHDTYHVLRHAAGPQQARPMSCKLLMQAYIARSLRRAEFPALKLSWQKYLAFNACAGCTSWPRRMC